MARARLYAFNGTAPKVEPKGQAAVILDVLRRNAETPKLAVDLAKQVEDEGNLKTRQDILRVTLYYIIVFKNRGLIAVSEQPNPEAPDETVDAVASADKPEDTDEDPDDNPGDEDDEESETEDEDEFAEVE